VFDHVTIRTSDPSASQRFYDTVLVPLGIARTAGSEFPAWGAYDFFVLGGEPLTRGLHIGFTAPTPEHVDEFWRVGIAAGYADDGAPGPRPQYSDSYYGAFLLDPDGNSVEAVHHADVASRAMIDHLWLRVADVAASKRFCETIAPYAGFRPRPPGSRVDGFTTDTGSFSIVPGEPTVGLHMAFPARDNTTVDAFHRAATSAGYRDNGGPGERPYHEGYYSAFVLDPDGNNIEVVNHDTD
jgi:catechol 2,3-dioxygenase-like lactoylglutathione lyase family enzyme